MTLLAECDRIEEENFKKEAIKALQKVYGSDIPIPTTVKKYLK